MNDQVWREDSGYITMKSEFPVKAFAFGDLGQADEALNFTVGPMLCQGNVCLTQIFHINGNEDCIKHVVASSIILSIYKKLFVL